MKNDISSKEDVILLVNTFYDSAKTNKTLGYIFNDVVSIDWDVHMPRMYSFWASILLEVNSFTGNPMAKHIALSKMTPITKVEFDEWLRLFKASVDLLFEGDKANEAKSKAANIAKLMLLKIEM
jgi:hemoglobin